MAKKENAEPSQIYPLAELLASSEALFGCKPEIVRGALHGDKRTDFTVDEVKKAIDNYLKRRVI